MYKGIDEITIWSVAQNNGRDSHGQHYDVIMWMKIIPTRLKFPFHPSETIDDRRQNTWSQCSRSLLQCWSKPPVYSFLSSVFAFTALFEFKICPQLNKCLSFISTNQAFVWIFVRFPTNHKIILLTDPFTSVDQFISFLFIFEFPSSAAHLVSSRQSCTQVWL